MYEFSRLIDQVNAIAIMLFIVMLVLFGMILMVDALQMFIDRLTN